MRYYLWQVAGWFLLAALAAFIVVWLLNAIIQAVPGW